MRRPSIATIIALTLTAAVGLVTAQAAGAAPKVPKGPAGLAFYEPPSPLPGKAPGHVIWARKLADEVSLPAARKNILVLYRSANRHGEPVAVSGTVAIPPGKRPPRGWPVVSFGYGVLGLADRCAPSRGFQSPLQDQLVLSQFRQVLNELVKAGYAVVVSDYYGLGTPGDHSHVDVVTNARSVLDLVRAARKLRPKKVKIGRRFVAVGHSQGGAIALWTNGQAPTWAPRLRLRGTVAYAPPSQILDPAVRFAPFAGPGFASFGGLAFGALDAAYPELGVTDLFTETFATAHYPEILSLCTSEIFVRPDLMALTGADVFLPGVDLGPAALIAGEGEPRLAGIRGDVLLVQGTDDELVLPEWTEALADQLRAGGAEVNYATYNTGHAPPPGHQAHEDVLAWIRDRLR